MTSKEKLRAKIVRKLNRIEWTRHVETGMPGPPYHLTIIIKTKEKQHQKLIDDLQKALK